MRTKKVSTVSHLTTAGACIGLALAASAADQPAAATTGAAATPATASPAVQAAKPPAAAVTEIFKKPAWLTELSLGVKEGYDDNLLLVSEATAASMRKKDAWFTTISPKIGLNFAPLLPDQKIFQAITFAYTPEFVIYHNGPTDPGDSDESYNAHKVANAIKGKVDKFSFSFENAFAYVDGSDIGPVYFGPDSARSAFATGVPRERREQIQDRAKIVLQYDQENWFARPVASLLYYDLMVKQLAPVGTANYQNYMDRYDVNGGADFGYRLQPKLAATIGYRAGHQYQQKYDRAIFPADNQLSGDNDYQRVLFGLEGKPWKWLNVSLQAGPDFRHYRGTDPSHTMPVNDPNPVKYYAESTIAAEITPQDSLNFKYKQWQWLSSTGKIPLFDSSYELSYRRKMTSKLSVDVGGRIGSSDYTGDYTSSGATGTSWQRDDWMYTTSVGLAYAFTPQLSANLAYAHDWGRNQQDDVANGPFREFERSVVSLGVQFKF